MKQAWPILAGIAFALTAQTQEVVHPHPFSERECSVVRMDGEKEAERLNAEMVWVSRDWGGENAQMPYLIRQPERDQLLLLVECGQPIHSALLDSHDGGRTWTNRRWMHQDASGQPDAVGLGLTNLGGGVLRAFPENLSTEWKSTDFGDTWSSRDTPATSERYTWDPWLVLPGGAHVAQTCWRPTGVPWGSDAGPYSQAFLRTSLDGGATWSEDTKVPQWLGVNEVCLLRARNGDWVAACRTDNPRRFAHTQFDHYSGLAVSLSHDEGKTWSDLKFLHEFGRHHPSMALLPDGRIVMTYVVRLGYPDAGDGYGQFGVEAVISGDNGLNWDLEHRYLLARWTGNILGDKAWFCSVQSTSTTQLADGTLLTAFGTGFRNTAATTVCKMDVALVRWHLKE